MNDPITRFASAIRNLEAHAWREISCQHGVSLAQDCESCEPLLDHDPGFYEEYF